MGPEAEALVAGPHSLPPADDEEVERLLRTVALRVVRCKDRPGAVVELLRREALYSSHLTEWRKERDRRVLGKKRSEAVPESARANRRSERRPRPAAPRAGP